MKAFLCGFVCLLWTAGAFSQSNSQPELKPRGNPVQDLQPGSDNSTVAPDAPVITINGVCDKAGTAPADCKTVMTREQFEKIIDALQPSMPKQQQKQFAGRLVTVIVLADKAHQLGLDQGSQYDEQLYLARLQIAARLAGEHMQKDAGKVSDAEIADYYNAHSGDFRTISYDRIYVPKQKAVDTADQKPNDPDAQKKRLSSEAAMKEEADKLRARAGAGEDFAKLQQEAYDFAGMKLKASNTRVDNVRKNALPPSDAAIFDLKKGEVSQVLNDPQGFMIYKVEDFQSRPLADVREEVSRTLQAEKIKNASEALEKTVQSDTTYNDAYFPAAAAPPSLRNPGEAPPSAPSASHNPGKK